MRTSDPGYPYRSERDVAGGEEPGRHDEAAGVEIDRPDRVLDQRHERAVVELHVVVGETGMHLDHRPELATSVLHGQQPDELEGVEAVGIGRGELGGGNGEHRPAVDRAVEPDRAATAADAPDELDGGGLPVGEQRRADAPAPLVLARVHDHEGAVEAVGPSHAADHHPVVGQAVLVRDLEHEPPVAPRTGRPHHRAQRPRDAPLAADHLADVVGRAVEAEDDDVALVEALDPDRGRVVDEPSRDPGEQLVHATTRSRRP